MPQRIFLAVVSLLLVPGISMAQVTWDTAGDGNWDDAINWSSNPGLPLPADDVVIDQGSGLFLITLNGSSPSINTLTSEENLLLLQNVDLTMAMGGTINGSLTLGTNSVLTSNGGVFNASGTTVLDGGNVFANSGATMNLLTVSSYLTDTGTNSNRTLQADGSSLLDLSGMTTMTGGGFIRRLHVNSRGASLVDLSGLMTVNGGATFFEARDTGSVINISNLTTFTDTNGNRTSGLRAIGGGIVNASSLVTIEANGLTGGNSILVDGATSTVTVSSLATMRNTSVELINGGTVNLGTVTDITGSEFSVNNGVTLDLSQITSYVTDGGGNGSRNWGVDGAGSVLDMSGITTAAGGGFIRRLNVSATNGGNVDLSSMTDITGGATTFLANGAGSLIDLSSLQNFNDDNGNQQSLIQVLNGGEVRLDTNAASNLTFNGVNFEVNPTGILDTSRIVDYTFGTFTTNGVNQTLGLADGTSSSFIANAGATLDISSLTGTVQNTGPNGFTMNMEANGAGSTLDMSGITALEYNTTSVNPRINLRATDGGSVDAGGMQTLSATGGIINSNRAISVFSDGVGSVVDLTALTTYSDLSSTSGSEVRASNSGSVLLGGTGTTTLTNVDLIVESGGTITGDTIELISQETNSSGAPDDFSVLSGDSTITANIINTSGIVSPGLSPGTLTIDGNYTQGAGGTLNMEIVDLTTFDVLAITGDAALDGTFTVSLDAAFDLADNMDFQMLTTGGSLTGMFAGLGQNSIVASDNGFDLRIVYSGSGVMLTTSAVPEPGAFAFLGLALAGVTLRRRRRQ